MTSRRVAIVTQFPVDPESPRGGVEAVSVNLVRALAKHEDLDVHVVTLQRNLDGPRQIQWEGATLHCLQRGEGSELTYATGRGRAQVAEALGRLKPDVIHSHDTYGLMVKGIPVPRVFTIHGFIYGDTLVSGQRFAWLRSRIWRRVETAGWADQPHIISISPYVRERLAGIFPGTIHDIDNPISDDYFGMARQEQPGTIFSAAAICPRKNTLVLVRAAALLARRGIDVRLRLAGPVTDEAYGALVQREIAESLGDRAVLLGQIRTPQIKQELACASLFALVSLEENSPMGIEEAMAVGVPVVTSNRCGMPYMVRHGESGFLVDPHNVEDVAVRMEMLLGDDKLRSAASLKGIDIARDRFHPDRVAERTRQVYDEACQSLRGRSNKRTERGDGNS